MNLQFISDNTSKTTGMFISISQWNALKFKYKGIDQEQLDIPAWQMNEVRKRIEDYRKNRDKGFGLL